MAKIDKSEYIEMFISEAKEHLANLNNALLVLEKDPSSDESLTVIFRAAHTIKGNAATMGFEDIRDLTHKMEDVLDRLRKHEMKVTVKITDILFECLDMIGSMISGLSNENSEKIDTREVQQKLSSLLEKKELSGAPAVSDKKDSPASSASPSSSSSSKDTLVLTEEDILSIEQESKKNTCFSVDITLASDCVFKAARAHLVVCNLGSIGKILKSVPGKETLDKGEFDLKFTLVLSTDKTKDSIKKLISSVAEIESADIVEMPKTKEELSKYLENHSDAKEAACTTSPSASASTSQAAPDAKPSVIDSVQSVRVSMTRLDKLMNLVGELLISKMRLEDIEKTHDIKELKEVHKNIDRLSLEIQDEIMEARMIPADHIFGRFPRLVRDLSHKEGKDIELILEGKEIELDRTVLDRMGDPLVHLIRNCIDHGIESPEERMKKGKPAKGTIKLIAKREKSRVSLMVSDDGGGMDPSRLKQVGIKKRIITPEQAAAMKDQDAYNLIFTPGFSTNDVVTEISGRGVGMDVVRSTLDSLGGKLKLETEINKGTIFTMSLPLTIAIQQALLIRVAAEIYAVPVNCISETIKFRTADIKRIKDRELIIYRGHELPIIRLDNVFNLAKSRSSEDLIALVVLKDEEHIGFVIDEILGERQIIIKTMNDMLKNVKGFAGGTILGDGRVALILDVNTLVELA